MKITAITLSIGIFILLFIEFFHPITAITQDLGRHMKTGEIIFQIHHVPKINLFSYTYAHFPFINTHWLSEVIFYIVTKLVGFHGLVLFTTLITLLAFAIVFFTAIRSFPFTLSAFPLIFLSLLYFGILAERTDVRPEIFSFLFTASFVAILYEYRAKFTRLIFLLPVIELLWVNMHIYFIVGIVLIGLFLTEAIALKIIKKFVIPSEAIAKSRRTASPLGGNLSQQSPKKVQNSRFSSNTSAKRSLHSLRLGRDDKTYFIILLAIFILTSFTTLVNPNFLQGALYPFSVLHNYGYSIQENQNIFFLLGFGSSRTILFFLFSVILLFFCLLVNFKKTRLIDWLLAIVFTILACMQIRNFVLFVFATFIPFSYSLTSIIENLNKSSKRHAEFTPLQRSGEFGMTLKIFKGTFFTVLFLLVLWQGYSFIEKQGFGWDVPSGAQPAVDFFVKNNLHGPIFNNFDIGSYLDYALYPKEKVFVDGRPEAYPASFFQKTYIPMQQNMQIFIEKGKQYRFDSIFFAHTDQTPWAQSFIRQIVNNPDWYMVYLDNQIVILVKDTNENKKLIYTFGMNKEQVTISHFESTNINQLLYLANFFISAGWTNQEAKIDQQILKLDENFCPVLSRLVSIYSEANNQLANVYGSRYRQTCQ